MNWELVLEYRAGGFHLRLDEHFEAQAASVFGPSGAGKSTLIELVAGLRRPAGGRIRIGGRVLFDAAAGVDLPPAARRVGWVPQDGALFPHLTVRANLGYGARARRIKNRQFDHTVAVLELAALLDRRPAALSGGERQRVALGRALLSGPEILLFDEPLASLDVPLRSRIFPYLVRVRDEFKLPILYVSHDANEVRAIAEWVVAIKAGRVQASGTPEAVLPDPLGLTYLERFAAENVFEVTRLGGGPDGGAERVRTAAGTELTVPANPLAKGNTGTIAALASEIIISLTRPEGISTRNVFEATIEAVGGRGPDCEVSLTATDRWVARLTCNAVQELELRPGKKVWCLLKTYAFHWLSVLPED